MNTILTLPIPPSNNQLRIPINRGNHPELIKSQSYRDWETLAHYKFVSFRNKFGVVIDTASYNLQYQYKVRIFVKDKRKDISNFDKAILDFMKGRVFTDDKWVSLSIQMPVLVDSKNPRVEIDLNPEIFSTLNKY